MLIRHAVTDVWSDHPAVFDANSEQQLITQAVSEQSSIVDAVLNEPTAIGSGSDQPTIADSVVDEQTLIDMSNAIMNTIYRVDNDDIVIEFESLAALLGPNDVLEIQIPDHWIDSAMEVKDRQSTQDEECPRRFRKRNRNEISWIPNKIKYARIRGKQYVSNNKLMVAEKNP